MATATLPAPPRTVPTVAAHPAPPPPPPVAVATGGALYRFSVAQYEAMIAAGVLTTADPVELLDGFVVTTMPESTEHGVVIERVADALRAVVPGGWVVRTERPVALSGSVPEPDVQVARGRRDDYYRRRPTAADLALVVEVAVTSLAHDRTTKLVIYARDGVPAYWVIDIAAGTVEAWGDPAAGAYRDHRVFRVGDNIPVNLANSTVGPIAVADLLGPPA